MHTEYWLVYCGYLLWLSAGLGDFICHRRTDLPHTSGVAESVAHLVQLGLLGVAIVLGLAFETNTTIALVLGALVAAHAVVGYIDTRIAFRRQRIVLPIEQHLHSVLDIAPIAALGWVVAQGWRGIAGGQWGVEWRDPAVPLQAWLAVLVPAAVLCVLPSVMEFVAAIRARRNENGRQR